jgi:hypothetical protein
MKPTLYVETSIFSYLAARRSRDIITAARQEITRHWWQTRRESFLLVTSGVVLEEASAGDSTVARRRLDRATGMKELEMSEEAIALAEELMAEGPLPRKAAVDALHITIATVHKAEYLLTWNCKHIANAAMRNKIEAVCRSRGYTAPIMCTPEELMEG